MSDDSESDSVIYYAAPFRCRLCCFQFDRGDTVVADVGGKRSEPFQFLLLYCAGMDEGAGIQITLCRDRCDCDETPGRYDKITAGYHEACLDIWGPRLPPSSMHGATAYAFAPSWFDSLRRSDRIRQVLYDKLPKLFPEAPLPRELWSMIANDELVRMCAVQAVRELWERRNSCSAELDLSQGIWAHYMHIEGVRYVERLTRAPGETLTCDGRPAAAAASAATKLLDGSAASVKTVLYVLEDYLGVRQIVFATPDCDLSTLSAGVVDERLSDNRNTRWWRTVQLGPGNRLRALSDGLKIRSIKAVALGEDNTRPTPRGMAWRVPTAPSTIVTPLVYTPRGYQEPASGSWYMASIACNAPGVTGYSAFWCQTLLALHAHRREEDLSFYRHYDQLCDTGLWIHFPLAEGERLVHVFNRGGERDCDMGLLFRTSRGRDMVFGPALKITGLGPDDDPRLLWYRHICSLPADVPTRIHYNASSNGIRRLAFEQAGPRGQHPPIRTAWTMGNPTFYWHRQYFTSTVHLDGVVTVTPLYKTRGFLHDKMMICGLLFNYADGRPETCLGEFRLDHIREPIDVSTADALYFGYFFDGKTSAHLTQVSTSPRAHERTMTWFRVPLQGCVELWYSSINSAIYHAAVTTSRDGYCEQVARIKND